MNEENSDKNHSKPQSHKVAWELRFLPLGIHGIYLRLRKVFIWIAILVTANKILFSILMHSTVEPWNTADVSPDGRYEVRYYSTFSWRKFLPTMPGHGFSNIDGYIRLYDRSTGKMLHEAWMPYLASREAFWCHNSVVFLGEDGFVWPLDAKKQSRPAKSTQ